MSGRKDLHQNLFIKMKELEKYLQHSQLCNRLFPLYCMLLKYLKNIHLSEVVLYQLGNATSVYCNFSRAIFPNI